MHLEMSESKIFADRRLWYFITWFILLHLLVFSNVPVKSIWTHSALAKVTHQGFSFQVLPPECRLEGCPFGDICILNVSSSHLNLQILVILYQGSRSKERNYRLTRLWNKRSTWNNRSPQLKKFHITSLLLFYINLGIAVIFYFFFLQNFSKINKRSSMFIRSLE